MDLITVTRIIIWLKEKKSYNIRYNLKIKKEKQTKKKQDKDVFIV